jgi:hypothetical protein
VNKIKKKNRRKKRNKMHVLSCMRFEGKGVEEGRARGDAVAAVAAAVTAAFVVGLVTWR